MSIYDKPLQAESFKPCGMLATIKKNHVCLIQIIFQIMEMKGLHFIIFLPSFVIFSVWLHQNMQAKLVVFTGMCVQHQNQNNTDNLAKHLWGWLCMTLPSVSG